MSSLDRTPRRTLMLISWPFPLPHKLLMPMLLLARELGFDCYVPNSLISYLISTCLINISKPLQRVHGFLVHTIMRESMSIPCGLIPHLIGSYAVTDMTNIVMATKRS